MRKITALFVGIASLTGISTTAATVAEAKDGCGRGMFYNGQRCVPKDQSGIRLRELGSFDRRLDRWSDLRRDRGWSDLRRDRFTEYTYPRRGVSVDIGRGVRLNFGSVDEPRFSRRIYDDWD